ncbi:hypothetical protein Bca52824_084571 [Brassica carinata]|uniref:Uncharacterized protein n=1 Tax=Brassica carinata TaxID=52824 RepID=A0A8X7PMX4_BRACI|nr:hypothetical protein Bca52824_084571 [Brassica carinata]
MASKLQKWRNLSNRIDLISRRDALSTIRLLHEGPDTMEELLDRHLAKKEKPPLINDDEAEYLAASASCRRRWSLIPGHIARDSVLHVDGFEGSPVERRAERER